MKQTGQELRGEEVRVLGGSLRAHHQLTDPSGLRRGARCRRPLQGERVHLAHCRVEVLEHLLARDHVAAGGHGTGHVEGVLDRHGRRRRLLGRSRDRRGHASVHRGKIVVHLHVGSGETLGVGSERRRQEGRVVGRLIEGATAHLLVLDAQLYGGRHGIIGVLHRLLAGRLLHLLTGGVQVLVAESLHERLGAACQHLQLHCRGGGRLMWRQRGQHALPHVGENRVAQQLLAGGQRERTGQALHHEMSGASQQVRIALTGQILLHQLARRHARDGHRALHYRSQDLVHGAFHRTGRHQPQLGELLQQLERVLGVRRRRVGIHLRGASQRRRRRVRSIPAIRSSAADRRRAAVHQAAGTDAVGSGLRHGELLRDRGRVHGGCLLGGIGATGDRGALGAGREIAQVRVGTGRRTQVAPQQERRRGGLVHVQSERLKE
mmetsp:Transcript_12253/g.31062  ORF Transcript_12253/g.31062 Transcript_12253/m.31062 type:complete len:435 (+) Transcript_12253:2460-3764(+)